MNNLINEKLTYNGDSDTPTHLHVISYNSANVQEFTNPDLTDLDQLLMNDGINWIQIHGLKNTQIVNHICNFFQIDFLTIQDILNTNHLSKIEEFDNYIVCILKIFKSETVSENTSPFHELSQQHICAILGKNFVLTFMEEDSQIYNGVRQAIKNNTLKIRNRQSDYLFSVLLNEIIANHTGFINHIDSRLDDLEEQLFDNSQSNKDMGLEIQTCRRQYITIKKAVMPIKDQYSKFLRTDNPLIHRSNRVFYNDVNDHLQFVIQTIESCRETLSSLVDLYISNNDLKMNAIMKQLTIVSTIFIPLTFLAGIWGMNFTEMPELNWKYGYAYAWGLMLITGGAVFWFFKKKKWY